MKTVLGMRRLVSRVPAQSAYRPSSSTRTSHPLSARSYSVALPPRKAATTYTFSQSRSRSRSRGRISGLTPCTAFQRNSSTTRQQEPPPSSSTSSSPPRPLTDRADTPEAAPTQRDVPAYELTFTCKPCLTRSTHRISKHGYEKGTVLITCPNCKNRHVISDHLGIFSDRNMTIEQLLAQRGEAVKRGVLSPDGDIELWDDGTTQSSTSRSTSSPPSRFGEYSENEGVGEKRIRFSPGAKKDDGGGGKEKKQE